VKQEILCGVHAVTAAINASRREIAEILLAEEKTNPRAAAVESLAEQAGLSVSRIGVKRLAAVAGTRSHQGVAAVVSPLPLVALEEIASLSRDEAGVLLLLDAIEDPRNMGALVRTALCCGVRGVVIPKDRCARPVPTVSRASAGALEYMPLAIVANMANAVRRLKGEGYWVGGLDIDAGADLYRQDLTGRLAVLVGGENRGLRPLLKKQCDFLLRIPQQGPVTSLNASVAGALVLYEALRQRHKNR
jgi:23S rRNA (guanosine2251-2'-O)-methyltransferase